MKRTILLSIIFISCFISAQNQPFSYEQKWKELEQLQNSGQFKSLLPKVDTLYQQAKKDGKGDEIVNALMFRAAIIINQTAEYSREDDYKTAILDFEREITAIGRGVAGNAPTANDNVTRAVLQSLLASMYQQYAQNTQWKRRNITELETPPADIAEWSTRQLLHKSFNLYSQSCDEIFQYSDEKTENWKQILTSTQDIDLFPTLFDVLSMRFFDFCQTTELDYHYANSNNNKIDINFTTKELAQNILAVLINFHENDKDKSAFLNYKLKQIELGFYVPVDLPDNMPDTFNIAEKKILELTEKYKTEPFAAYLYFKASEIYRNNGDKRRAYDNLLSFQNLTGLNTANNKWTKNAKLLMEELQQQNVSVRIAETSLPNEPIAVNITHKNCDKVYYRIYKIREYIDNEEITGDTTLYKTGVFELKPFDDFLEHSTIVKLDGLPAGTYFLQVSNNEYFKDNKTDENYFTDEIEEYFYVNNWSIIRLGLREFQLLDRKTGKPIANKNLQLWDNYEDENQRFSVVTDKQGIFSLKKREDYDEIYLYNPNGQSFLPFKDYYRDFDDEEYEQPATKTTEFFTDRAIYRPNQKVYFKAILYTELKNKVEIAKNQKVKIILENTNYQKVAELDLISNEYGSVFGEFILPQNGLTGSYHLESDFGYGGYIYFRVEEYKRPKFEVKMDELKGDYVLEQEIKVSGVAESYAGAAISEAKVVYRVARQEIIKPIRWGYYMPPTYYETITNGETQTDSEGKFFISFVAKAANSNRVQNPVRVEKYRTYKYKIFADVTDINGETHSTETAVTIGDLPKKLEIVLSEKMFQKDFKNIGINSTNLNGVKANSKGQIVVTQLITPERIILTNNVENRHRYHYDDYQQKNKYQLYDYQTFIKYFPHLPYNQDETNPITWQKGKTWNFDFDTEKSENVAVETYNYTSLQSGVYLIEAVTMHGNDSITTQKVVQILNNKTFKSTNNVALSVNLEKTAFMVGEKINIAFVSDIPNAVVALHLESGGKWVKHDVVNIKKGKSVYSFTALPQYAEGGLCISAFLVWENGFQQVSLPVKVTDKPKNLIISTKTFRDKLTPNAQETWELTISGADKDKIIPSLVGRAREGLAEVLATMYDFSLDAFTPHFYKFAPFNDYYRGNLSENISILNSKYQNVHLSPNYKYFAYITPQFPDFKDIYIYKRGKGYTGSAQDLTKALAGEFAGVQVEANIGQPGAVSDVRIRGLGSINAGTSPLYVVDGIPVSDISNISPNDISSTTILKDATATSLYGSRGANGVILITTKKGDAAEKAVQQVVPRKNLQETAFFYPNLYTDENGDVKFTFTSPEALTKWKLLVLAHTQDLRSGTAEFYAQTQKELMVVPNVPRFLREGDEVVISAKINSFLNDTVSGWADLTLTDALTGKIIFEEKFKHFDWNKSKNAVVDWTIKIPQGIQAVEYKIIANVPACWVCSALFSDGEQGVLPVLPNRMLVTETMPIFAKEGQTKIFTMEKLTAPLNPPTGGTAPSLVGRAGEGLTRQNFNLTLELTTNPLWLAVMSLPYLREYPYECSEQIFSRLYGNMLSTHILNQNPKIKSVFDAWNSNPLGFENLTGLEANQELKNILLEETPFLRNAQNEEEQRKRLALMFDLNNMSQEFSATQQKLIQRQNADGGFSWFEGGQSSPYITEHIVQGFGQLRKMLGENNKTLTGFKTLLELAIKYIDAEQVKEIKRQQENIKKYGGKIDGKSFIHYYYVRSFWKEQYPLPAEMTQYLDDINKNVAEYFNADLQRKAMIATTLWRYGYYSSAQKIVYNLKETSVETDEMGMYWKDNRAGWNWYQSPVETQTKIIEAFNEIGWTNSTTFGRDFLENIEEMKIWLMKNRQTNAWNSTKATTDAVYALMNFGKDWTNAEEGTRVWIGGIPRKAVANDYPSLQYIPESPEGYVKKSWKGDEITPDMGIVTVDKTSAGTMWGGLYWQYFENLDKITSADSNVKMEKSLFKKINTPEGQKLVEIPDNDKIMFAPPTLEGVKYDNRIYVGDLVTVRLVIHIDREMQYIHIKDMRAAGFEPINVLSGYKYQNGCAYYESTRDAATNFFFERMQKGVYVFEYDVRANNAGTFSNGITTLQNMYAPEMSCHSSGMTVEIKEN